jgi:hypothetical protein
MLELANIICLIAHLNASGKNVAIINDWYYFTSCNPCLDFLYLLPH